MSRRVLLACGVIALLFYVTLDTVTALRYEGYRWTSQAISELSAVGAPTRGLWLSAGLVHTLLSLAFAWGVWVAAGPDRRLRTVARLLLALALLGFVWPFGPMHQREVLAAGGGTWTDTLHLALSAVTIPLNLVTVGIGSGALGRRFRAYSLGTLAVLLVFGVLTGRQMPDVAADLPTPMLGVWERIVVHGYMLWTAVLAVGLWRSPAHGRCSCGGGQGGGGALTSGSSRIPRRG